MSRRTTTYPGGMQRKNDRAPPLCCESMIQQATFEQLVWARLDALEDVLLDLSAKVDHLAAQGRRLPRGEECDCAHRHAVAAALLPPPQTVPMEPLTEEVGYVSDLSQSRDMALLHRLTGDAFEPNSPARSTALTQPNSHNTTITHSDATGADDSLLFLASSVPAVAEGLASASAALNAARALLRNTPQ